MVRFSNKVAGETIAGGASGNSVVLAGVLLNTVSQAETAGTAEGAVGEVEQTAAALLNETVALAEPTP
jgi:hypothetical protein